MNLLDINPNLHLSFVEQCFISPILKEYTYLRSIIEILFKLFDYFSLHFGIFKIITLFLNKPNLLNNTIHNRLLKYR